MRFYGDKSLELDLTDYSVGGNLKLKFIKSFGIGLYKHSYPKVNEERILEQVNEKYSEYMPVIGFEKNSFYKAV